MRMVRSYLYWYDAIVMLLCPPASADSPHVHWYAQHSLCVSTAVCLFIVVTDYLS